MLKIKTGVCGQVHLWKKGEPLPMNKAGMSSYILTSITSIEADGDELIYIVNRFSNIPCIDDNNVVWGQPWADFIYQNLVS
jgi:hypothetical protein